MHSVTLRNTRCRLALGAFLLWEAWWIYEFFAAPQPDYEMQTVFALIMGGFAPVGVIGFVLLIRFAARHAK